MKNGSGSSGLLRLGGLTIMLGFAILICSSDPAQAQTVPPVSFQSAVNYSAGNSIFVAVADFNRDGKLDLVTSDRGGGVNVLLGNGDGTFRAAVRYSAGSASSSVAVGDFNGDGMPDLAVTNFNDNTVSILIGNGDGSFQSPVDYPVGTNPIWVAVADFNKDGKLDLAVANNADINGVSILLGNGDGSFQTAIGYSVGSAYSVAVADFNDDGILDLAVGDGVLLGNGDGTFRMGPKNPSIDGFALAVGDFNGDGRADLAVTGGGSKGLGILLGNGDGTFQPEVSYATASGTTSVAVGDFNGDGRLDLAVANQTSNTVGIYLGNGNGAFLFVASLGGDANSVAVGDFNGDGKPDIASAYVGVAVALNDTTPSSLAATSTMITSSATLIPYGQPVTLTATATSFSGEPAAGTISIGTLGNGDAPEVSITTTTLGAGMNSITATYSGDSQFAPSTSLPVVVGVKQGLTSTSLTSSANPSVIGQSVTYLATLSANGPATGSITFSQNSIVLADVPLVNGQATYSTLYQTTGRRKITAMYSGDGNNIRSSSGPLNQTVNKAPANVAITSSANPSSLGQAVMFTITVTSADAGLTVPAPAGTVNLLDGTTRIGTGKLNGGTITITTSKLATGTHSITATYVGNTDYLSGESQSLSQVVN
jgi:hypothetical protein